MDDTTILYICPDCASEVFWFSTLQKKPRQLVTPVSFTAVSNCDTCANWIHKNFHIMPGLFSTPGITVKEAQNDRG